LNTNVSFPARPSVQQRILPSYRAPFFDAQARTHAELALGRDRMVDGYLKFLLEDRHG
jgi:hypothetical protein